MKNALQTITIRKKLDFSNADFSLQEINFDEYNQHVPEGLVIHKDPILFKQDGDYLVITFMLLEKGGKAGFHAKRD